MAPSSVNADDNGAAKKGIAFRLAERERAEGLTEAVVLDDQQTIFLPQENVLTDKDLTSICFSPDGEGGFGITLQFKAAASERLEAATKSHIGKPLAILLDGKVITAPTVNFRISRSATITGRFSDAQLTRMFAALVLHDDVQDE